LPSSFSFVVVVFEKPSPSYLRHTLPLRALVAAADVDGGMIPKAPWLRSRERSRERREKKQEESETCEQLWSSFAPLTLFFFSPRPPFPLSFPLTPRRESVSTATLWSHFLSLSLSCCFVRGSGSVCVADGRDGGKNCVCCNRGKKLKNENTLSLSFSLSSFSLPLSSSSSTFTSSSRPPRPRPAPPGAFRSPQRQPRSRRASP